MNTRIAVVGSVVVAGLGFGLGTMVGSSYAGGEDIAQQAAMEKWAEYSTPGPEHARIHKSVGRWDVTTKRWDYPGAEPVVGTASAVIEPILDGRYVVEHFKMMMPMGDVEVAFEGRNFFGFDNLQQKYVYAWMDSMQTGIITGAGTYDRAGKTLTMISENAPNPIDGVFVKMKSVSTDVSDDERRSEMFSELPDGSWFKSMEFVYRRAD